MKYFSILLFSFFLANSTTKTNPITKDAPFVIIQLFTSQGCSSCPPADMLVERIKKEYEHKNVYVLSYHVDYWDRLGWKDPFGKKEFTEIQYRYADQFRERQVYTPQIVVNGREHFVGSNGSKLKKRINTYLTKNSTNTIAISSNKDSKGNLVFSYEISGYLTQKELKLAFVLENQTTQVTRGENKNRSLTNTNIVVEEFSFELNNKSKGHFTLPKGMINFSKKLKLISFIQNDQLEITGAHQLDL